METKRATRAERVNKDHLMKAVHLQRMLADFLGRDLEVREIEVRLNGYILEEVEKAKTVYGIVLRDSIKFENVYTEDPVEQAKLIVCENIQHFPEQIIDWAVNWGSLSKTQKG